jgi:ribonucleoside-diphosphate reductase alpha chain
MFNPTGFSLDIFKSRYAFTENESWEQACSRVAKQMALAEVPEKQAYYDLKFAEILSNNYFVPGGRIWYNSGRNNPQLLNCFVLDPNKDSKEGWGNSAKNMIITSMTGGGCGDDFSDVRPRGAEILGQKGECPGPVELMRLIDACSKPVRAGGQRRVALMFSLDLDHPDIEEFLDAKLEKGQLTHANVSVRSKKTKEFIKAVREDGDWELSWKGKYKKTVKAKKLWDKIVKNAWNSAEPGFLNWEMVSNESNIHYIEELVTTNPCGEIALSAYDCCCLGHLVLPRFVKEGEIDYALLGNTIRTSVRFLDNV